MEPFHWNFQKKKNGFFHFTMAWIFTRLFLSCTFFLACLPCALFERKKYESYFSPFWFCHRILNQKAKLQLCILIRITLLIHLLRFFLILSLDLRFFGVSLSFQKKYRGQAIHYIECRLRAAIFCTLGAPEKKGRAHTTLWVYGIKSSEIGGFFGMGVTQTHLCPQQRGQWKASEKSGAIQLR